MVPRPRGLGFPRPLIILLGWRSDPGGAGSSSFSSRRAPSSRCWEAPWERCSASPRVADEPVVKGPNARLAGEDALKPHGGVSDLAVKGDKSFGIGLRLGESNTRREATHTGDVVSSEVGARGIQLERPPRIGIGRRKVEIRGHHADHLPGGAVDLDDPADDLRIRLEDPGPQCVAEKDQIWTAGHILVGGGKPADYRLHAEQRERARGQSLYVDLERWSFARQGNL